MTKVKANAFSKAIAVSKEEVASASNKKKADKLMMLALDAQVADALTANNVDAKRFDARALYATEKCVKVVYAATRDAVSASDVNENAFATIKTLINARSAKVNVTKRDIECALSSDQKLTKDQKHVFQRKNIMSAGTLAAQSQQCVDMIKTLKIVEEVSRNVFKVNDSALMKTFEEKFANIA